MTFNPTILPARLTGAAERPELGGSSLQPVRAIPRSPKAAKASRVRQHGNLTLQVSFDLQGHGAERKEGKMLRQMEDRVKQWKSALLLDCLLACRIW